LKNDAFSWTQEATQDFENLRRPCVELYVLATLDFTKTFIVECDALGMALVQF
jgi:hypothetical protein